MFGYNTLGFGSIAGPAGPIDLDFAVRGGQTNRANGTYTGVSIGTANTNRMVVLQGGISNSAGTATAPTLIAINGTAMTRVSSLSSFIAWAKVPTGTTATIGISGGNSTYATRIFTFNTINTTATQATTAAVSVAAGTIGQVNLTRNPVATDGVFIWSGTLAGGGPVPPFVKTISSSGAVVTLTAASSNTASGGSSNFGAYSTCSTTDSRYAQLTGNLTSGSKGSAILYGTFTYFQAN